MNKSNYLLRDNFFQTLSKANNFFSAVKQKTFFSPIISFDSMHTVLSDC